MVYGSSEAIRVALHEQVVSTTQNSEVDSVCRRSPQFVKLVGILAAF